MKRKIIDRTGQMQGTMLCVSFAGQTISSNSKWNAKCVECGYEAVITWRNKTKTGCKSCHGKKQLRHIKYRDGYDKHEDLYMIRCGPYVKIGVTNDIERRLISLQSGNPYLIELVGLWKGEGHREKEWHEALAHLHVRGEWFKLGNSCELT